MSRTNLPLYSSDISAFARSLNHQIGDTGRQPSHLELLNMLARSAGYRNFQHLRAQLAASDQLQAPEVQPQVDFEKIRRLARYFDAHGLLARWPAKQSSRDMCLWVLWSRIPPRQALSEHQFNVLLNANHLFKDPALLRRDLYDGGFVRRTPDCREYRRVEKRPPEEARELVRMLEARREA